MKVLLPGIYRVEATIGNCRSSGLLRFITITITITFTITYHLLLLLCLHADEVHAHLPADVPRVQPARLANKMETNQ